MGRDAAYAGPARADAEVDAARELAALVLDAGTSDARDHKQFIWSEPSSEIPGHVIVAASASGQVLAVVRLVPRALRASGDVLKVAGISSVCVAESARQQGLARLIMNEAVRQAHTLGYDVTMLFARRAVDHFYPRFDIWGLASYTQVKLVDMPVPSGGDADIRLRSLADADVPLAACWHRTAYAGCAGAFERSVERWRFLLQGAARRDITFSVAESRATAVGYVATRSGRVLELGFEAPAHGLAALRALRADGEPLILDMPSRHQLLPHIQGGDFSVSSRRCDYGGHMMGVLDRGRACSRLARRISRRARELGLGPREERIDGLILGWDGREGAVRFETPEAQGRLGPQTTARLVGARLAGAPDTSVLAPTEPLDFLPVDEF